MDTIKIEDLEDKCDSMYRLVLAAARRAAQIAKPEVRPLVPVRSKKTTETALEEIAQGKIVIKILDDEDDFSE